MRGYASNLISALDNIWGKEVTVPDLLSVIQSGRPPFRPHSFWYDILSGLRPMLSVVPDDMPLATDTFCIQPHWVSALGRSGVASAEDCERCVDAVKSFLLYYPRVCIGFSQDFLNLGYPSRWRTGHILPPDKEDWSRYYHSPKHYVIWFLKWFTPVVALRRLVQDDIVMISPVVRSQMATALNRFIRGPKEFIDFMVEETPLSWQELNQLIERIYGVDYNFERMDQEGVEYEVNKRLYAELLSLQIASAIYKCESISMNFVADSGDMWSLLHSYLKATTGFAHTLPNFEAQIGQLSAGILLPATKHIDLADIVDIRANSEDFEEWRSSLRYAINRLGTQSMFPVSLQDELQYMAKEVLYPRAKELRDAVTRQKAWAGIARGVGSRLFLTIAGAATAGALVSSPVAAMVGAGLPKILIELWDLSHARPSPSRVALLRHYSLLVPDS